MALTSTATVELRSDSPPAAIWDVLSDGWTYASWVVGTSRVRDVDPSWPQPGARLHHSFGIWPLVINDNTEVLELEPGRRIRLRARGWPTGEATVEITTSPADGASTQLTISEDVTSGPARLLPKPLRQTATVPRNRETLRRLSLLASGRPG
jgi:hypothetical protein